MQQKKRCVGVIFGGMSAEHEVSWLSARNVLRSMDQELYFAVPILITKNGHWFFLEPEEVFSGAYLHLEDGVQLPEEREILLQPGNGYLTLVGKGRNVVLGTVDVIFPIVHGPFGEDGTLQGLCKMFQVPFVGPGVLASALCMDKAMMKKILIYKGIPTARFAVLTKDDKQAHLDMLDADEKEMMTKQPVDILEAVIHAFGFPLFVKPAQLGSSVGISKVVTKDDLCQALDKAFLFDHKVIVEEYINGREVECSVLGATHPIASIPGEIVPQDDFYSYKAKYIDEGGAKLTIPADLPPEQIQAIQDLAIESFCSLGCEGMARVDFFVLPEGKVLVNELNTLPGFTDISMYPKLLEASGISTRQLIDQLIQMGFDRFQKETTLSRNQDKCQEIH